MRFRRRFLFGSALAWLAARVLPAKAGPITGGGINEALPPPVRTFPDRTLRSYVDVLIPADQTPSGTDLGVHKRLREVASGQRDYQDLLERGLAWLDSTAQATSGRDFSDISEGQRESIVQQMASAGSNTLHRVFFERTRADAFFHYYGRPESWRGIRDYAGPPQPAGYIRHNQAPRPTR